jgi:hypothetical protein
MRKIALKSKELYTLWVDGSDAGVEEVDLERRDSIYILLNSVLPYGALSQPVG